MCVAALLGACSTPPSTDGAGATALPDITFGGNKFDSKGDGGTKEAGSGGGKVDPASCPFPPNPTAGEAGASCKTGSDCQSGFCLDSADGKICTVACVDCCPVGMACSQISSGADFALVCVPQMLALCRPCLTDAECSGLDKGALCIDSGDTTSGNSGRFCGAPCVDDGDCADGYGCKTVSGEKGAGPQCVPDGGGGSCGCSKNAILAGASTSCTVANAVGTCGGWRKCGLDGLTLCDAPSPTAESCNGQDDDCDGSTDEPGASDCKSFWGDGDDDGFGGGSPVCLCAPDALHSHTAGADCNDKSAATHPGAAELCNGQDDNCDGVTDEAGASCTLFWTDSDGDGWGGDNGACLCQPDATHSATKSGDCNDGDKSIHPTASEVCNGADDNCNGATDEAGAATTFYYDGDGDGWGTGQTSVAACSAPANYVAVGGDCDDGSGGVHPGVSETCNSIDDNCNGATDEGTLAKAYFLDVDGDGYGATSSQLLSCTAVGGYVTSGGDCADGDPAIYPGKAELCDNKDNNCDGGTDEGLGAKVYYPDKDGDSYGDPKGTLSACAKPSGYVTNNSDCDDGKANVNPGLIGLLSESASGCNGQDNDCDGYTDNGNAWPWYPDSDGDGYGTPAASKSVCIGSSLTGYSRDGSDCNDKDAAIHPNGVESFCDGTDQDCIGGDYCGSACSAAMLYDFTTGPEGWSVGGGWTWDFQFDPIFKTATTQLAYEKDKQSGYPAAPSGASSKTSVAIPSGAKAIQVDVEFENSTYEDSNNVHTPDPAATVVIDLNGATAQVGPYASYNGKKHTVSVAIDPAWWKTQVPMTITVTTPNASTDSWSGFFIDNIQIVCP